jgi:hypothetical protein
MYNLSVVTSVNAESGDVVYRWVLTKEGWKEGYSCSKRNPWIRTKAGCNKSV